jgi:hypothetical protein
MTNAKNLMMKLEIELEQFKNCTVSYEKEVSSSVHPTYFPFSETKRLEGSSSSDRFLRMEGEVQRSYQRY